VAGERHGNGTVCVNRSLKRQGNSGGTAWERHGMCESALMIMLQRKRPDQQGIHTLFPIKFAARSMFCGENWPRRETDHFPPSFTEGEK
jgi:hypothetical protein